MLPFPGQIFQPIQAKYLLLLAINLKELQAKQSFKLSLDGLEPPFSSYKEVLRMIGNLFNEVLNTFCTFNRPPYELYRHCPEWLRFGLFFKLKSCKL